MEQIKENMLKANYKEMIRLNIKPNFAALGRQYGCDYRTAKAKYYEELNTEKGIVSEEKIRKHIIDEYKGLIIDKLENVNIICTMPTINNVACNLNFSIPISPIKFCSIIASFVAPIVLAIHNAIIIVIIIY